MGNKIINVKKLVETRVHRPRLKDEVLYARNDCADIPKKYSSPTNLRGVCLSVSGVTIRTWVEAHGTSDKFQSSPIGWDTLYGNSYETIKLNVLHGNEIRQQYIMNCQRMGKENVSEPDNFKISNGNIMRALVEPWVCNNIQTIVFDELALLDSPSILANTVMLGNQQMLAKFICEQFGTDLAGLSKKFPCLKRVIFIENLKIIPDKRGLLGSDVTESNIGKLVSKIGGNYGYLPIKSVATKLEVRDGIYRLDEKLRHIKISGEPVVKKAEGTKHKSAMDMMFEKLIKDTIAGSSSEEDKKASLMLLMIGFKRDLGEVVYKELLSNVDKSLIECIADDL